MQSRLLTEACIISRGVSFSAISMSSAAVSCALWEGHFALGKGRANTSPYSLEVYDCDYYNRDDKINIPKVRRLAYNSVVAVALYISGSLL